MAKITDPHAMRALAHPVRIQLLELLVARGEATATELAEAIGQSTANCSYHLRTLERNGYIERTGDPGRREKPWRAVDPQQDISPDPADPDAVLASTSVGAAFREWDVARLKAAEGRPNPPAWKGTSFQFGATMIVTPDEARTIAAAIADVLQPYHARLTDRSQRPAGAGAVRIFAAGTYLPEYQETLDAQAQPSDGGAQ